MTVYLPHMLRQARTTKAAIAPPASASSLRGKSVRLEELKAQAAWLIARGRRQEAAELQREAERIREGVQ